MTDPQTSSSNPAATSNKISSSDAALYDRQIRLWGVDAQRRIQSSNVLLVGFNGLHVELAKNLVLAGMNVTIQDDEAATAEDLGTNFFLDPASVGQNRAEACKDRVQELNPNVTIGIITDSSTCFSKDNLTAYSVVSCEFRNPNESLRLDTICTEIGVPFYLQGMMGVDSFVFCNLGQHTCIITTSKMVAGSEEKETSTTSETITYNTLQNSLAAKWAPLVAKKRRKVPEMYFALVLAFQCAETKVEPEIQLTELLKIHQVPEGNIESTKVLELYNLLQNRVEFSPTCSIVAGIVGQEVIKAVSRKDKPIDNFFFYSGWQGGGLTKRISS